MDDGMQGSAVHQPGLGDYILTIQTSYRYTIFADNCRQHRQNGHFKYGERYASAIN
jgi:hypothetical protein